MSIKMLIVDDEPIIRQGLRLTVPWESYDIQVIGEASDGKQALDILTTQPVDIVLTDVRMPEMDGIQLTKTIHEQMSNIRVIIISGYDDFEYAREAMRYRVKDYLLKPVDIDELLTTVIKLKEEILEEKERHKKVEQAKIKELLTNRILHPQFHQQDGDFKLLKGSHFCVLVSELKGYASFVGNFSELELEEIRDRWEETVQKHLEEYCQTISFFTHPNLNVMFCYKDEAISENTIGSLLQTIGDSWKGPVELAFSYSPSYDSMKYLNIAYDGAKDALLYKEVVDGAILSSHSIKKVEQRLIPTKKLVETLPLDTLFKLEKEEVLSCVEELFETLRNEKYNLQEVVEVCNEINVLIEQRLREVFNDSTLDQVNANITKMLDLHYYNTTHAIKQIFIKDLEMWIDLIVKENIGRKNWIVEKAKEYILENFQSDIKASEVANEMHITPNYFSMVFKKEMGKSFNEYLNDLRIEKAKILLKDTSDRVFEIAKEVGYKEYKYFVQIFRKKTGMTPTDYREFIASS